MRKEIALKIIEQNKLAYDKIAKDFSDSRNKLWPEFEYFKGYLDNNQDILDLGCGNGRLLELLKDYNPKYLGLDFSQKLISKAQETWPENEFIVGDILDLSKIDRKFDIVLCVATLHHIPSKALQLKSLNNINQVLKPGGLLLMTNWNLWQKRYYKYIIKYTFLKLIRSKNQIYGIKIKDLDFKDIFLHFFKKSNNRYLHAFTEHEISKLITKAGFEIIKNVTNERNIITIAKIKKRK